MSFWGRVSANLRDVRTFGAGALLRVIRDGRPIRFKGIGRVALRRGNSDMECFREIFQNGDYRIDHLQPVKDRIASCYHSILKSGRTPVIIDGGANIGASALWFTRQYPDARVVAVEPDTDNFRLLKFNTAACENIEPVQAALGAEPGFVEVTNAVGLGWAAQTKRVDTGTPIVMIGDIPTSVEGGKLFIVKIDIEGFESDLFSSGLEWINEAYVVIVEPHDWMLPGERTSRTFMRAMAAHDFEVFIVGENLFFVRVDH